MSIRSDDFSVSIKNSLAKRVGFVCSNPSCKKPTSGPSSVESKSVNIGVAAHITAASKGGPRYDPNLTALVRKSAENGIWCCQNCAKLIDSDPNRYSVKLLNSWKGLAEETRRLTIDNYLSIEEKPCQVEIFSIEDHFSDHCLKVVFYLKNISTEPIREYSVTIHLSEQVAIHLRARNKNDSCDPVSLHFNGPQIYVRSANQPENNGWVRYHYMEKAKSSDHPLLPAGSPKPAATLDFGFSSGRSNFINELKNHPIHVEYWGGKGNKACSKMYLCYEKGKVFYRESEKHFDFSIDSIESNT